MDRTMIEKRWTLKPQAPEEEVERLSQALARDGRRAFSYPLTRLLLQRGIDENSARAFFHPSLDVLHDPFSMKDMEKAVERLTEAVFGDDRIMVLGDYDVDGTTSVAMMADFLREMGKDPILHVPDRYKEGYGVSDLAVERAKEEQIDLLITLDCGIKGHGPLEKAASAGIDTIICDHHRPGGSLPKAFAVLDPQRPDDEYPFGGLSGCGVAFKLLQAFCIQHDIERERVEEQLDLLAISIAADIVPMVDENRILTHFGLQRIEASPRPGIAELLKRAGAQEKKLDVTDLVFTIGPRINAAGRMDSGIQAVELLSSHDEEAVHGSKLLDGHNQERRSLDQQISQEALQAIEALSKGREAYTTVVHGEDWHKGVIGIVASRLIEHYYRPTIVLTGSGEEVTGSARSVNGFDIHQALENCSQYLQRFGGHRYAAGMTLKEADLPAFRKAFEEEVARSIDPELLIPEVEVDLELELKRINWRFFKTLERFGPFGPGNMQPLFLSRNVYAESARGVGKEKAHLKLRVQQEDDPAGRFPAIAFGFGDLYPRIASGESFHILYHIEMNEFKGQRSLQLRIVDIKFGEEDVIWEREKEASNPGVID